MTKSMIYARVEPDIIEQIDRVAEDLGLSRSAVVRMLLKQGVAELLDETDNEFKIKLVREVVE